MNLNGHKPNLMAPWKPGQSGNPNGVGTAGSRIKTWINAMAAMPRAELLKVIEDEGAPTAKVIAARRLISAVREDAIYKVTKTGDAVRVGDSPGPGIDFARIVEHTDGKAKQSMDVQQDTTIRIVFADEESVRQGILHGTDDDA